MQINKGIVTVLAVVLAVLVCVALVITIDFGPDRQTPEANTTDGQQTAEQGETTQPMQQVPETTEAYIEATLPQEGEGSPFDDMEMEDGPVIDVGIGGDEGPAPTEGPTEPSKPQETEPTKPTQPDDTPPTEPSVPQETEPRPTQPGSTTPTEPSKPQETEPRPTQPGSTTPTEPSKPQETEPTKPTTGGESDNDEWDEIIDFDDLLNH